MSAPRLSVVMTVRNGEAYLPATLESVLGQTFREFEFLICDDGSTDQTCAILQKCAERDPRVRIIRNAASLGPYPSANILLAQARAPLIARIDADDICRSDRFQLQVAFLDAHPDHLLVGSGYRSVDGEGRERYCKFNPLDDAELRWIARFRMPMVHPSFCFRSTYPDGRPVRYRETFPVAQDYALACDLLAQGKAASLAQPLIDYRMHGGNISSTRRAEQNKAAIEIALRQLTLDAQSEVAESFEPFIRILYSDREPDTAGFAASLQAFRADVSSEPSRLRKKWKQRRAAGMLAEAFMKGRSRTAQLKWAFHYLLHAPGMFVALIARTVEVKKPYMTGAE